MRARNKLTRPPTKFTRRPLFRRLKSTLGLALALPLVMSVAMLPALSSGRAPQPVRPPLPPTVGETKRVAEGYGKVEICFEANHGQTDNEVRFLARGPGYTLFLTATEAVFVLQVADSEAGSERWRRGDGESFGDADVFAPPRQAVFQSPQSRVVRMKVEGARTQAAVAGEEQLPGIVNYFLGADPTKWRTEIPTFGRVRYGEIYPGVDLVDFLNREPDAAGLAFWSNQIEACGADAQCREVKRINVSAAFFLSIEFEETGFLVQRAYRAAFNRLPRYREFLRDTQEVGRGLVVGLPGWELQLELNKQQYMSDFVTRPDFLAIYAGLTNEQYVDALNVNTGNSLSLTERNTLVAGLNGGMDTRASVLRKVAEDADFAAREFRPTFVLAEYIGYLRRNPDDLPDTNFDGFNFWLAKLNAFNGDFVQAELVKAFLGATEYRHRFGP